MKGDAGLVDTINGLLAHELRAVNQYMVHAEMSENWGYEKLHGHFQRRAIDEMKHAERLIGRILFLEGTPVVDKLLEIRIGGEVPQQLANDHASELFAIEAYNAAIIQAAAAKDHATKSLLEGILNDEDRHLDQIEQRQDQIRQMGLEIFLGEQIQRPEAATQV